MTQVLQQRSRVDAAHVHAVLGRHILADGFEMVLDLDASHGSVLVDARDGTEYLDLFTFFASNALGMNHPALVVDDTFFSDMRRACIYNYYIL